jgi:hypothetical protein
MEPGGAPLYVGEGARLVAVNRARTVQRERPSATATATDRAARRTWSAVPDFENITIERTPKITARPIADAIRI